MERPVRWQFGRRGVSWDATPVPRLMGVVNVTPDSFSDGGRFLDVERAVAHAEALAAAGADVLDVGGESTRPGSDPVPAAVEIERVVPVIRALRGRTDAIVSVDTSKPEVAAAAIAAGAEIINDVTALAHPAMALLAAKSGVGVVLMHMRGRPKTMQQGDLSSADIVEEVRAGLAHAARRAEAAGVARAAICLDPGIGFGKGVDQNVALVAGLPRLRALGYPVLLGVSRKSFLGALTGREVGERLVSTAAACAAAVMRGVHLLRVHDVAQMRDVVRVASPIAALAGTP